MAAILNRKIHIFALFSQSILVIPTKLGGDIARMCKASPPSQVSVPEDGGTVDVSGQIKHSFPSKLGFSLIWPDTVH